MKKSPNLKMDLNFWNKVTKYHGGLFPSIQWDYGIIHIKYYSSPQTRVGHYVLIVEHWSNNVFHFQNLTKQENSSYQETVLMTQNIKILYWKYSNIGVDN